MTDDARHQHASSFGSVAHLYDAIRPAYPPEAVEWLVPAEAVSVVDLGAGTGKLTRSLARPGRRVTAVDPSAEMLGVLRKAMPDVRALVGSAESIPLPDRSVDAIVAAQAWHWVDPAVASTEVDRVLAPHGTLGLVWNLRDERVDWVRRLGTAMQSTAHSFTSTAMAPEVSAELGVPEFEEFGWHASLTRSEVHDLVRSRSYFVLMPEAEKEATLAAVDRVLDTLPGGGEHVDLPYRTVCFRYRR